MIFKIVGIALICAFLSLVLKEKSPEMATVIQVSGIVLILFLLISLLSNVFESVEEVFKMSSLNSEYLELLIKILGIATVAEFTSLFCEDMQNSTLSALVNYVGKILIVILCIPMIKSILIIAGNLMEI